MLDQDIMMFKFDCSHQHSTAETGETRSRITPTQSYFDLDPPSPSESMMFRRLRRGSQI